MPRCAPPGCPRGGDALDGKGALAHVARMTTSSDTLARLEQVIRERTKAAAGESYVASLNARGLPVIARKLGEEAVETVVAALSGDDQELVGEAADVLFHLMVLLGHKGIALGSVLAELERREGTSGLVEKASRNA